jgi:hypothetical protein
VRFFSSTVLVRNNGHWNLLATLIGWVVLALYIAHVRPMFGV